MPKWPYWEVPLLLKLQQRMHKADQSSFSNEQIEDFGQNGHAGLLATQTSDLLQQLMHMSDQNSIFEECSVLKASRVRSYCGKTFLRVVDNDRAVIPEEVSSKLAGGISAKLKVWRVPISVHHGSHRLKAHPLRSSISS
eukprot:scaffold176621_cov42-Prasinocladus_malaysianus.AAC.2